MNKVKLLHYDILLILLFLPSLFTFKNLGQKKFVHLQLDHDSDGNLDNLCDLIGNL